MGAGEAAPALRVQRGHQEALGLQEIQVGDGLAQAEADLFVPQAPSEERGQHLIAGHRGRAGQQHGVQPVFVVRPDLLDPAGNAPQRLLVRGQQQRLPVHFGEQTAMLGVILGRT